MRASTLLWSLVQAAFVVQSALFVEGLPAVSDETASLEVAGNHVVAPHETLHSFAVLPVLEKRASSKHHKKKSKKAKSAGKKSGSFTGDGTYYTPGMGSCGIESTDKQLIAALNAPQMGSAPNPNKNPNCGRYVTVKGPKGSVRVKIIDTCPGCVSGDLDLSPAAFQKIAKLEAGRVSINWSWD